MSEFRQLSSLCPFCIPEIKKYGNEIISCMSLKDAVSPQLSLTNLAFLFSLPRINTPTIIVISAENFRMTPVYVN